MTTNFSQTAAFIWSLADLLRGDFKQSQYGRVILPFTILRRLECVLEATKPAVLDQVKKLGGMKQLEEEAREKFLLKAAKQSFFNTSPMDLSKLGSSDIKSNLTTYVDSFSKDAREIFEHFKFGEFIAQLEDANLLFKVVQKVASTDLSPGTISNHDMGLVFEELIRRFAEGSNETAGEHFTPRDIVRLTTALVFLEDSDALTEEGIIRTIYDPTAGTGGFLSSGMEYVHELNPGAFMRAFGQELNGESYAICKGDMLIKGQDVSRIKHGNTLSNDQLATDRFDYMLSNPPFGVDWKKVEGSIKDEHKLKGFEGRFGPGLPRVSDGSLLFLMHLISKMRDFDPNDSNKSGGRIGIILNGSPLFTGGAGSGESEIRRHILESDLLEAIVALPTDMFYNTGIATYIWILSNKKDAERKGKVQLINGVHLYQKMRKSLGSKRRVHGEEDIKLITRTFGGGEAVESYSLDKESHEESSRCGPAMTKKTPVKRVFGAKIFESHEFGYRRITVERPLRLSVQLTDERIAGLRFAAGPLNAVMRRVFEQFGKGWTTASYGDLAEVEADVHSLIKEDFKDLKEKQVKDLLAPKTWRTQKQLLDKAIALLKGIGTEQHDDFNEFETVLKAALKADGVKLEAKEKKQLLAAVSWSNPDAEPVIKKVLETEADPMCGAFEHKGQVVQFWPDSGLRANEDVPLTAETANGVNVNASNEAYFTKEVEPQGGDAWIDNTKRDRRDGQVGIVGYSIPFARFFLEGSSSSGGVRHTKLKRLLSVSTEGRYSWDVNRRTLALAGRDKSGIRVDVKEEILCPEYLNHFMAAPENEDWLRLGQTGTGTSRLPIFQLLEGSLPLPSLASQRQAVQLFEAHRELLTRVGSISSGILKAPEIAERELQAYSNATSRFEDEYAHILPHPLSILWVQANFATDDKEQCEGFAKFYEYLGYFSLSVVLGQLGEKQVLEVLVKKKGAEKKIQKSATMGDNHVHLGKVREWYSDDIAPQFRFLISEEWSALLKDAAGIRNEIAHRGLHAKLVAANCSSRFNRIGEYLMVLSRTFFEQSFLMRPREARFIRTGSRPGVFVSRVDSLRGLALNPAIVAEVRTSEPLEDGELYMLAEAFDDTQIPHRLFPIMQMLDTDEDHGISAFYFYNKWDRDIGRYLFVCPYPTTACEKHLDESTLLREGQ